MDEGAEKRAPRVEVNGENHPRTPHDASVQICRCLVREMLLARVSRQVLLSSLSRP
jgi:hypothetical protein